MKDSRATSDDSGIAMLTVVMLMLIVTALSVLMLGVLLSQVKPTLFGNKNARTVFAAEAGIDAALGQIRNARFLVPDSTGTIYGDPALLPCALSGSVDSTGSVVATRDLTYTTTIRYFIKDPAGQTDTWKDDNDLPCVPGVPPTHALISSIGRAGGVAGLATTAGDRKLETVYSFNVTNVNVPGGIVYSFGDEYCLRADGLLDGNGRVQAGSTISYLARADCGTDDNRQLWSYTATYQLKLASTGVPPSGGAALAGLCITGNSGNATLQPCVESTLPGRWNQLFSWEGGAHWRGQTEDMTQTSGVCLKSTSWGPVLAGSTLEFSGSCGSNNSWGSFNPDPKVGAGAASFQTVQIVNYLEFGRCFDVTDENPGRDFMIVYPCKQDPSGGTKLFWNHKFYYAEAVGVPSVGPQPIKVNTATDGSSTWYCLITPPETEPTATAYPILTTACNTADIRQQWTRFGDTGNYDTSYQIKDGFGRCASLGDKYASAWTKIIVAGCSGGAEQKWNAPPDAIAASVDDFQELTH